MPHIGNGRSARKQGHKAIQADRDTLMTSQIGSRPLSFGSVLSVSKIRRRPEFMVTAAEQTAQLLAPMIKKTLWTVLSTANVSGSEMEPHAPKHLHYMNGLEEKALVSVSGPFIVPGVVVGDGLTILQRRRGSGSPRAHGRGTLTKLACASTSLLHGPQMGLREGKIAINLLLSQSKIELV
jgi:uncharacterized protein